MRPIDTGTGVDGSLDLTGQSGTFVVNTSLGTVAPESDPTTPLLSAVSGTGEWHFVRLVVPSTVTLRAIGANPLVLRVQTEASILGRIDASGESGAPADYTIATAPVAGFGGLGGPAGGDGGDGGMADAMAAFANGVDGGLAAGAPPLLTPGLVGPALALGSGGGTAGTIPLILAVPALGGVTLVDPASCVASCTAGGGGGGGHAYGGLSGSAFSESAAGSGGTAFGNNSFLNTDLDYLGSRLLVGGGGGAGGGARAAESAADIHVPGSGGGGGGGSVQISVGGLFFLGASAEILADGGDAFQAAETGGNGGGGAGGTIRLQGNGLTLFEQPGAVVSARGGRANLEPHASAGYVGNGLVNGGGDGAAGRIRIETPIGVPSHAAPVDCDEDELTRGICPSPTLGEFLSAGALESVATSLPYSTELFEGIRSSSSAFGPAVLTHEPAAYAGKLDTVVLYQGASEDPAVPGQPGTFCEPVADVRCPGGGRVLANDCAPLRRRGHRSAT